RALAVVDAAIAGAATARTREALLAEVAWRISNVLGALVVVECVRGDEAQLIEAAHPDRALEPRLASMRGARRPLASPLDPTPLVGDRARALATLPIEVDDRPIAFLT